MILCLYKSPATICIVPTMMFRLRNNLPMQIKLTTYKLTKLDHEVVETWIKKQCQKNKILEMNKHTTKERCSP